jgi:hypothetical protein
MIDNSKPEWFEIADNDGPITPPKASKTSSILRLWEAQQMARLITTMKLKITN